MRLIAADNYADVDYDGVSIIIEDGIHKDELFSELGIFKLIKYFCFLLKGIETRVYLVVATNGHCRVLLGYYNSYAEAVATRNAITLAFETTKRVFRMPGGTHDA